MIDERIQNILVNNIMDKMLATDDSDFEKLRNQRQAASGFRLIPFDGLRICAQFMFPTHLSDDLRMDFKDAVIGDLHAINSKSAGWQIDAVLEIRDGWISQLIVLIYNVPDTVDLANVQFDYDRPVREIDLQ